MNQENPFKLLSSKEVYKNPWISVREDSVIRPGGKEGIFGVIDVTDGVTTAAVTEDNHILMVREWSYGYDGYTLECVSGAIDEDESPINAAKRELQEEAGAVSHQWESLGAVNSLTTIMDFKSHIFLAREVCIEHPQNPDEGEVIEVVSIPLEEAVQKINNNEITHDVSIVAILRTYLLLNQ